MGTKKKTVESGFENVRISKKIAELLRKNKKNTGMPIGYFTEQAVIEKLERQKLTLSNA